MFDNLSDKLDKAMHVLRGHGQITEINVAETTKEIRRALLDADVNFKIAKEFTNTVKGKGHRAERTYHASARSVDDQNRQGRAYGTHGWRCGRDRSLRQPIGHPDEWPSGIG